MASKAAGRATGKDHRDRMEDTGHKDRKVNKALDTA
jgi:hypothetical protein